MLVLLRPACNLSSHLYDRFGPNVTVCSVSDALIITVSFGILSYRYSKWLNAINCRLLPRIKEYASTELHVCQFRRLASAGVTLDIDYQFSG